MTADSPTSVDPTSPGADADRLIVDGDLVGAVDLLQGAYLEHPDAEIAHRLIELRARAGAADVIDIPWPPQYEDPFPEVGDDVLPEVDVSAMSVETIAGAVQHHGAVIIRGALRSEQVDRIADVITATEEHRDKPIETPPPDDLTYVPFNGIDSVQGPERLKLRQQRKVIAGQGGTWLADSPVGTAIVLGELRASGFTDLMTGHFGGRPRFSLQKSTLRRSAPSPMVAGWHQDGSFLGAESRTMNVWVALSPCGGDLPTPGLELIPKRVDEILPLDGDMGKVSISDGTVAAAAGGVPGIVPLFAKGDALVFDQFFVHRTHFGPFMDQDRLALECWMFAPGQTPSEYLSLLI